MSLPIRVLALLTLAVCLGSAQTSAAQTGPARLALIIGNSTYRSLPATASFRLSADMVNDQLTKIGFRTLFRHDLDQEGMIAATNEFVKTVNPGDVVLFYYAGYGMQNNDVNYLVPVGYDPKDPTELSGKAFQVPFVLRQLESRKAGLRIVVLDAAWDWPGLPEANQGLANMKMAMDRTLVSFPTMAGQVLKPPPANAPSRFTLALVDALQTPGLNLTDLFNRVARRVTTEDASQRPYSIQPALEDFYFVKAIEKAPEVVYKEKPLDAGARRENPRDLLTYVWILGSKFQMGCIGDSDSKCKPDEKPRHEVTLAKNFWISSSEVTVSAYDRFLNANPGHGKPRSTQTNYRGKSTELPITNVTWKDAQDYCKWAAPDGALPTEAQWEFAARAGKPGDLYPWGGAPDPTKANYFVKSGSTHDPAPIRKYAENDWHLFDMAGNVAEWVLDLYNPNAYQSGAATDPTETKGSDHVVRGGSFYDPIEDLRTSARSYSGKALNTIGFRCVLLNLEAR